MCRCQLGAIFEMLLYIKFVLEHDVLFILQQHLLHSFRCKLTWTRFDVMRIKMHCFFRCLSFPSIKSYLSYICFTLAPVIVMSDLLHGNKCTVARLLTFERVLSCGKLFQYCILRSKVKVQITHSGCTSGARSLLFVWNI